MLFVILSVLCSVSVALFLKLARNRAVNTKQLIVWNYPVAIGCTYFFLSPEFIPLSSPALPWNIYIPLMILLPMIFVCIALAIQYAGIVKTEVAQRLSLFIPLLAAFFLFKEHFELSRFIGIGLGFIAILLSIGWQKAAGHAELQSQRLYYPLAVFLGMGLIDILFKQVAQHTDVTYSYSMFIIFIGSFIVGFIYLLYLIGIQKQSFSVSAILWGILVGAFNFANILFYMKAHRALPDNPSIVFTAMNIGVIVLGTAVGVFIFKERLSLLNKMGLCLAVVAVLLIAYL